MKQRNNHRWFYNRLWLLTNHTYHILASTTLKLAIVSLKNGKPRPVSFVSLLDNKEFCTHIAFLPYDAIQTSFLISVTIS